VLLCRRVPGYRKMVASELPGFVQPSVVPVFGHARAERQARRRQQAAAALAIDGCMRDDPVAPNEGVAAPGRRLARKLVAARSPLSKIGKAGLARRRTSR
jgi:hypothetical protein